MVLRFRSSWITKVPVRSELVEVPSFNEISDYSQFVEGQAQPERQFRVTAQR
jgi:hypothetical protein